VFWEQSIAKLLFYRYLALLLKMNRREFLKKLHGFSGSSVQNHAVLRSKIMHFLL